MNNLMSLLRGVTSLYNPQLETFLCVAECGSFNKAAEKLYISTGGHQAD